MGLPAENGTAYRLARIEGELQAHDAKLDALSELVTRADERWQRLTESVDACWNELRAIRKSEEIRAERDRLARESARLEKKSDRRWQVGTIIAVVTAILAAAGLIANALAPGVVFVP